MSSPFVEQFRRGKVPIELRLLAAQGALPLGPADLVELLVDLTADSEEEVRSTSCATLVGVQVSDLLPIAADRNTPPRVLAWLVTHRIEPELRGAALQNVSLADEAIEALAGGLSMELAELVVINQQRLLGRTSLLEALEVNPHLEPDQRRRLRELRETFKIGYQEPAPTPPSPSPPAPEPEVAVDEPEPASAAEAEVRYLEPDEQADADKVSAVQKLYRLTAKEKIITALRGTREERAILVRDPNRLVWSAVLSSPKLTDAEVESFVNMKNVSSQALRQIGDNKDWARRAAVVLGLVKNPRTPIDLAIRLVPLLSPTEKKALAKDRNVSEAIRKAAQRFVKT